MIHCVVFYLFFFQIAAVFFILTHHPAASPPVHSDAAAIYAFVQFIVFVNDCVPRIGGGGDGRILFILCYTRFDMSKCNCLLYLKNITFSFGLLYLANALRVSFPLSKRFLVLSAINFPFEKSSKTNGSFT